MSGTSRKFIIDLEGGKSTCELGRALSVAAALGIELVDGGSESGQNEIDA